MRSIVVTGARYLLVLLLAGVSSTAGLAQDRPGLDPVRERQLEDALKSGQALTDLSLSAGVTFRQLNRAEYAVPVNVQIAPASELTAGRGESSQLDLIAIVTDPFGTTVQRLRDVVELKLAAVSLAAQTKTPIAYNTSFTLLPGRYTIKLIARDRVTGRMGSTEQAFTIPNLAREQRAQ